MYKIQFYFDLDNQFMSELAQLLLDNLDFEPEEISIMETPISGFKHRRYNKDLILKLFKQEHKPNHTLIYNEFTSGGVFEEICLLTADHIDEYVKSILCSYFFLSIKIENYEDLLNNPVTNKILESEKLILAFIYNFDDVDEQSRTILRRDDLELNSNLKVITENTGDRRIDVSDNWGRYIPLGNRISLVASPMIWFGKLFKSICPWETLLNFKYAHLDVNYIRYELFDIENDPKNHRELQKEFWNFINACGVIKTIKLDPGPNGFGILSLKDDEQRHIRYMKGKGRVKI